MPYYERQPYIQPVHQLIREVLLGEIRIPRFQRKGTETTWTTKQRGDLLDSIYRGFPVGMLLIWSTRERIRTLEKVGGFRIPESKSEDGLMRLLLDGHQRLSTLTAILGPGLDEQEHTSFENWVFDVSVGDDNDELRSRERFLCLPSGKEPGQLELPLSIAFDRIRLNAWIRQQKGITEESIQMADGLRDRLRECTIPVAVLSTDRLDEATESFQRINSSGTPMSHLNMVAALAYEKEFDLFETIEKCMDEVLEPIGWREFREEFVLRVVAGMLRQNGETVHHPLKLNHSKLAKALKERPELIREAVDAMAAAAGILEMVGVFGPKILPYSYQLVTLAVFFAKKESFDFGKEQVYRWFWLTTYGSVFQRLSPSCYERVMESLKMLAKENFVAALQRDISKITGPLSRSYFQGARGKAFFLAMAKLQDGGERGPAHDAIARRGAGALLIASKQGSRSEPKQMVISVDDTSQKHLQEALVAFSQKEQHEAQEKLLQNAGFDLSWEGSVTELLGQRYEVIELLERDLVSHLGLEWSVEGEAFGPEG